MISYVMTLLQSIKHKENKYEYFIFDDQFG